MLAKQVQQYILNKLHYIMTKLVILGMNERWFNKKIYRCNSPHKQMFLKHIFISIVVEKAFDESQYSLMILKRKTHS